MINLTYEQVRLAALEYHNAGLLSAQGPTPEAKYRDASGFPCAIGASLSDDDVEYVEYEDDIQSPDVLTLVSRGVLRFPSLDEARKARKLQSLHDLWVSKVKAGSPPKIIKEYSEAFKKVVTTSTEHRDDARSTRLGGKSSQHPSEENGGEVVEG